MAANEGRALVSRVKELGGRDASYLENESVKVLVDDQGGMIPQLTSVQERRQINAHWLPNFRGNSGEPYREEKHGDFWKSSLLYNIAGNFPCAPNFGAGHIVDGITMPPYGWTANMDWKFVKSGVGLQSGAAWALSTLKSPESAMPMSFIKIDAVIPSHPVHYTSLTIKNSGAKPIEINTGFHNTVGSPFLQTGCKISASADIWTTPAPGGEFDDTTNLAMGAEFIALTKAPLKNGGKANLSEVPGMVGITDFVTGAIPSDASVGWSSLVNPKLKLAYITFFPGPAAKADLESKDDIILYFNDLWMQYGGRRFSPWSSWEGGPDLCFCLGLENSVGAYTYGLEYARSVKKVLDSPTTVTIPANETKTLYYGTLFAPYEKNILDGGIVGISFEEARMICKSSTESWNYNCDPSFKTLKALNKLLVI
ncbi:MAG: hypothetical protein Ta2B_02690 [Termitinemataceae bacterium]|nr:MAG: hypothetical protein Ta2B_02690 [Termitinemataceae bacterium]